MAGDTRRRGPRRPTPAGAGRVLVLVLAVSVAVPVAVGGGTAGASGGHYPSAIPGRTTGTYPSFLPKSTLDPDDDTALVGTEAKPALQIEGLPIEVKTSKFDVRVTVSGPVVPGEGLPNPAAATTCTWTVTMKDATAAVPVSVADFHSVDHLGSVFLMGLVPGEHAPPPVLRRGQTLTFQLRAYELVGEGQMQWAPDHKHVVGDWDYTVEND